MTVYSGRRERRLRPTVRLRLTLLNGVLLVGAASLLLLLAWLLVGQALRPADQLEEGTRVVLADGLTESARNPETYEQDMEVLRLPFADALLAAFDGKIVHSGSVTALGRAAHALELL